MQKNLPKNSLKFFTQRCREKRLKITPQRTIIYQELLKSRQHPNAEKMLALVRDKLPNVSLDTVNRTLITFAQIGLVDVVEGRGAPKRYDPDLSPHHHFHCVECGMIEDFRQEKYDELEIPREIRQKHTVFNKRVVISGLCEQCSNGVRG